MSEKSYFWPGVTTGDATIAPYDDQEFVHIFGLFLQYDRREEGVVDTGHLDFPGGLAVTGGVAQVTVASGVALVDGSPYTNSATEIIAIPTPVTSTRIDRIVLRKEYSNFKIRVGRTAGVEGGGAPALVQDTGGTTYWDISLATVSVTTGGVITVTRDAVAVRTPLGPGYQIATLTAIDSTHTALAWNSLGASGVKISLGPGKWAVQALLRIKTQTGVGTRFARIYNNTLATAVSTASGYGVTGEDATMALPPVVVDLTQQCEMELQFYALSAVDDVYGDAGATGTSTSIYAQRVV